MPKRQPLLPVVLEQKCKLYSGRVQYHVKCATIYLYCWPGVIPPRGGKKMDLFLSILKSVIYGVIEGITEWLPISSTGHMILVDEFFHVFVLLVSLLHQILPASAYHTSLDESIVSTPQNATYLSMTHNSLTVSENCTKSFCSRAGLDRRAGFVYSIEHEYHAGGGGDALRVFRRRRFPHF